MALREALQKGGSVLLEPIMKVEVVTPEDYTGSVIGDINSRRGPDSGAGHARQRQCDQRHGAARQHVSAMSATCAPCRKGAPPSPCSSITTNRFPRRLPPRFRRSSPEATLETIS